MYFPYDILINTRVLKVFFWFIIILLSPLVYICYIEFSKNGMLQGFDLWVVLFCVVVFCVVLFGSYYGGHVSKTAVTFEQDSFTIYNILWPGKKVIPANRIFSIRYTPSTFLEKGHFNVYVFKGDEFIKDPKRKDLKAYLLNYLHFKNDPEEIQTMIQNYLETIQKKYHKE